MRASEGIPNAERVALFATRSMLTPSPGGETAADLGAQQALIRVEPVERVGFEVTIDAAHDAQLALAERDTLYRELECAQRTGVSFATAFHAQRRDIGQRFPPRACLDVATAWGYVEPVDAALADRMDHITAVLWRLTH